MAFSSSRAAPSRGRSLPDAVRTQRVHQLRFDGGGEGDIAIIVRGEQFQEDRLFLRHQVLETAGDLEGACTAVRSDVEVVARDAVEVSRGRQQAQADRIDDGRLAAVVLAADDVRGQTEVQAQTSVVVTVLLRRRAEDPEVLRVQTCKVERRPLSGEARASDGPVGCNRLKRRTRT